MKKIFITIAILVSIHLLPAQENRVFYYHHGEKIYLDMIENTKTF